MKTALEMFIERLLECDTKNYNSMLQLEISQEYFNDLVNNAKIVAEEQIKRAYLIGCIRTMNNEETTPTDYYNETYKNTEL